MEEDKTLSQVKESAYKLLSYRPRSKEELRRKLRLKGYPPKAIEEAIEYLEEKGYLNDAEYAYQLSSSRIKHKLWGKLRIASFLTERGIASPVIEQTLKRIKEEFEEKEIIQRLLKKRFKDFSFSTASQKEKRRVIQHLQRKGFSFELIAEAIKAKENLDS